MKKFIFLPLLLISMLSVAQPSVSVMNTRADYVNKTVTFDLSWDSRSANRRDTVWVLVDYQAVTGITKGPWQRAALIPANTVVTATGGNESPYVPAFFAEPNNVWGLWIHGGARQTNKKFRARVTLQLAASVPAQFNCCVHATDSPPNIKSKAGNTLTFAGTKPANGTMVNVTSGAGAATFTANASNNTFVLPAGMCVATYTDPTACPGWPMSKYIQEKNTTISTTTLCADDVATITLVNAQPNVDYVLFKNNVAVAGTQVEGNGGDKQFAVTTVGTYTVKAVAINGYCASVAMRNSHTVTAGTAPEVVVTAQPPTVAVGASSTLTASGADGYQWRNGLGQAAAVTVSPVVATTYTVIGSNANGCTDTASVVVDVLCPLKATSQTATFAGFAPMVTAETGDRWSLTDKRDNKVYQAVKMPDGKYWMVQNLNYQEGLTFQQRANQPGTANGSGSYAIGSFWCPGTASAASSTQSACNIYGALYTWETAMMVDGRCSDEAHTNCGAAAWSESWMTGNYYTTGAASTTVKAQKNNARGAESSGGGGRGICPPNWHIPTHSEWTLLLDKVDGAGTGTAFQRQTAPAFVGTNNATGAGARLKAACVCLAGTCATNDYPAWTYVATYTQQQSDLYGLRVLPAGTRASNGAAFRERGTRGYFWLSSVYSTTLAYHRSFWHSDSRVTYNRSNRSFGVPVRCVFDGNIE